MSKPTNKHTDPDVISAADVAALLGVDVGGIYEASARGEIPSRRVGRRVLFSRRAVDEWIHGSPSPALPE